MDTALIPCNYRYGAIELSRLRPNQQYRKKRRFSETLRLTQRVPLPQRGQAAPVRCLASSPPCSTVHPPNMFNIQQPPFRTLVRVTTFSFGFLWFVCISDINISCPKPWTILLFKPATTRKAGGSYRSGPSRWVSILLSLTFISTRTPTAEERRDVPLITNFNHVDGTSSRHKSPYITLAIFAAICWVRRLEEFA